jgi:hypothetical protein
MAGWKTDWLYQLIFKEVAAVWGKVRSCGRKLVPPPDWLGTPPDWLCVQELRRAECIASNGLPNTGLFVRPGKRGPLPHVVGARRWEGKRPNLLWGEGRVLLHYRVARGR